jgi:flagellar biogenesis protein FliO
MNKGNERLMAILMYLRKMPRWALILLTVTVIIILGVAMFLLLPQNETSKGDASYLNSTGLAFSVFLKMGVVILLIGGLAIILRRWKTRGSVSQTKLISVVETVHLTQHRTLYLLNIDGQKILIGATDQSMTNLYQVNSTNEDPENQQSSNNGFSDILANLQSPTDLSKK